MTIPHRHRCRVPSRHDTITGRIDVDRGEAPAIGQGAEQHPVACIPQPHGPVIAGRHEQGAVSVEGDVGHEIFVSGHVRNESAVHRREHVHPPVRRSGHDGAPVGTNGDRDDALDVKPERHVIEPGLPERHVAQVRRTQVGFGDDLVGQIHPGETVAGRDRQVQQVPDGERTELPTRQRLVEDAGGVRSCS